MHLGPSPALRARLPGDHPVLTLFAGARDPKSFSRCNNLVPEILNPELIWALSINGDALLAKQVNPDPAPFKSLKIFICPSPQPAKLETLLVSQGPPTQRGAPWSPGSSPNWGCSGHDRHWSVLP